MNDDNTPRDCSRSAIIAFRLIVEILPISCKASYADSRTLHGLGCPSRTPLAPWRRLHRNRPTFVEGRPPLMPRPVMVLSIYFRFVPFISIVGLKLRIDQFLIGRFKVHDLRAEFFDGLFLIGLVLAPTRIILRRFITAMNRSVPT